MWLCLCLSGGLAPGGAQGKPTAVHPVRFESGQCFKCSRSLPLPSPGGRVSDGGEVLPVSLSRGRTRGQRPCEWLSPPSDGRGDVCRLKCSSNDGTGAGGQGRVRVLGLLARWAFQSLRQLTVQRQEGGDRKRKGDRAGVGGGYALQAGSHSPSSSSGPAWGGLSPPSSSCSGSSSSCKARRESAPGTRRSRRRSL